MNRMCSDEIEKLEQSDKRNRYMPYDPNSHIIVVSEADIVPTSQEEEDDEDSDREGGSDSDERASDADDDTTDDAAKEEAPAKDPWDDWDRFTMISAPRGLAMPGSRPARDVTQEDDEFDKAFHAMVQESLEARKFEPRSSKANMAIPMSFLRPGAGSTRNNRVTDDASTEGESAEGGEEEPSNVQFQLLTKKGTRQVLNVPRDCTLAMNRKSKTNEELEEQRELKRFVLQYEEREGELDDPGACLLVVVVARLTHSLNSWYGWVQRWHSLEEETAGRTNEHASYKALSSVDGHMKSIYTCVQCSAMMIVGGQAASESETNAM